jgi:beta-lactam-binding protein with PASTA domain
MLEGLDVKAATVALQSAGLQAGHVQTEFTGAKNPGTVLRQMPPAAAKAGKGSMVYLTVEESVVAPNLVGLDYASALRTLENMGLRLQAVDKKFVGGTLSNIVGQVPEAGKRVAPNSGVNLTLDDFVVVPDYVGQSFVEVRRTIAAARLQLGQRSSKADRKAAPGTVLDQMPDVGTKVAPGTAINFELVVAPGEAPSKPTASTGSTQGSKPDKTDQALAVAESVFDLLTNKNEVKPPSGSASGTTATATGSQTDADRDLERVGKGIELGKKISELFRSKNKKQNGNTQEQARLDGGGTRQ